MACFSPITLRTRKDHKGRPGLIVPCSRCLGCRLERSRQMAIRGYCELQLHEKNSFITLTYRDEDLVWFGEEPTRPTLNPRDFQLFMKRLRKEYGKEIRFFGCGEYGSATLRPHYHICLFNHDFTDKKVYSGKGSETLFTSESLEKIWGHGDCKIGEVTYKSIAYVARYICEKKLGKAASYYEEEGIEPEFVRMSLKPGLGSKWYDQFKNDLFPHDYLVVNGMRCKPPRYFSLKKEEENPTEWEAIKKERLKQADKKGEEFYNLKRLAVKERIKKAQLEFSKRKL